MEAGLRWDDVGRLRALRTLGALVGHPLPLLQVPVPRPLDLRVVDEQVPTAVGGGDEAIPLLRGEPLDDSVCHAFLPMVREARTGASALGGPMPWGPGDGSGAPVAVPPDTASRAGNRPGRATRRGPPRPP